MASKNDIPLVSKASVEFFASMFKELNQKTYTMLRMATIPNNIHDDTDYVCLPESSLKNFMKVLGESLENDKLGLLFLRSCKETYIPRFIGALTQGNSLKEALEEFAILLKKESSDANVHVEFSGGKWWFVREKNGTDEVWFKYAEMFSVVFMGELLRALTNNHWYPTEIGIQDQSEIDFKKLPTFSKATFFTERPVTAVLIPEELILKPVKVGGKRAAKLLLSQIEFDDSASFSEQFKLAIRPYISMGKLPIKIAAEILRLNVRTLQRRLEKENIVYQDLIEEMVFDEIKYSLRSTNCSISHIANQFGYSDSAHFCRSFKRVVGTTPTKYRKQD